MVNISQAMKFMRDVRMEATKITWPNLKDTRTMTIMVFILVVLIALYLMFVDFVIGSAISWLLRS